ncbi:elongation factor Ts, mitochondrial [Diorhabda sublineata]|uniref:elongation factor Ts, mitochondrial n=1 Tax=Diorhabda sublineata TaxID=1163346 RepID=UPI0024E0BA5D|nr:elongation factor Ts, mitochondrial [Diorhabda sublineata]
MIFFKSVRHLYLTKYNFAAEKSLLATLRKKTGYTFANCKKALEMHNNNITDAEVWLKQQAQALGWSKATKLEGRQATQGLVGVAVDDNSGVLVEVNCETDFVSRNKEFHDMVQETTISCLNYVKNHQKSPSQLNTKIFLDSEQLKQLKTPDGKILADRLALMIGTVGENAILKRAMCLKVGNGVYLTGYAHPSGTTIDNIQLGRLGGLLAYKVLEKNETTIEVARGICQHIVGMRPTKLGCITDKPNVNKEEETCLIHQEYLLDDTLTVNDVLNLHNIEIVDFKRFECGESAKAVGDQPLEYVETCQ